MYKSDKILAILMITVSVFIIMGMIYYVYMNHKLTQEMIDVIEYCMQE